MLDEKATKEMFKPKPKGKLKPKGTRTKGPSAKKCKHCGKTASQCACEY
jgi:hypothetical protein